MALPKHVDGYIVLTKPAQATEDPAVPAAFTQLLKVVAGATAKSHEMATRSAKDIAAYQKELHQLQQETEDHHKRMLQAEAAHRARQTVKPPQASLVGYEEMSDEDDKAREDRLSRTWEGGGTLTQREWDWLKRRGRVRY